MTEPHIRGLNAPLRSTDEKRRSDFPKRDRICNKAFLRVDVICRSSVTSPIRRTENAFPSMLEPSVITFLNITGYCFLPSNDFNDIEFLRYENGVLLTLK